MNLLRKVRALVFRKKFERDMADEMRMHLHMKARSVAEEGASPEEAYYAARRSFGGEEQIKEIAREQRSWIWLEQTLQDLRYAIGSLRRNPVFTLTAVLTLVLGLGSTTTIFTLVDAILWRPLPWAEPHRLVRVEGGLTGQTLRDWAEAQQVLGHIETNRQGTLTLSGEGEAVYVLTEAVSPGMFDLLGRRPALGRSFEAADAEEGNQFVVMLSDTFWRQRFGADPTVVGRKLMFDDDAFSGQAGGKLTLNSRAYTVIGVMPRGFAHIPSAAVWIPLLRPTTEMALQGWVQISARLRPGVDFAAAQAAVTALNAQLDRSHPQPSKWNVQLVSMAEPWVFPRGRQMLLLTLGAVTFVLLIACANVANLLLVRATVRQREFAVRAALGAGGGRLIRQVFTESLVLVVLGAAGGLLVACWAVIAIWQLAPRDLTFLTISEVRVDWRVGVFALGLVGLAAVVCGLVPALRASRFDANQSLTSSTRTATGSRRQRRWQHGFVVAQTALAFVLLASAGLLLRGFLRFSAVSPGFEISNLAAIGLHLPEKRYPFAAQQQVFYERLRERVATLPGVTETTLATTGPWLLTNAGRSSLGAEIEVEGRLPQKLGGSEIFSTSGVAENYFRVMRIPLVRGRTFGAQDAPGGPPVIIISDRMARRFWPDADPIGQRVRFDASQTWMTIVGVAGGVKSVSRDLNNENSSLEYYQSLRQADYTGADVVVRTAADPERLGPAIRREVTSLDPKLPVGDYFTIESAMARSFAISQFCLKLMLGFAVVALVLAAVGLYGVMSYTVVQRTQEIGVRIALGGTTDDIVRLVTRSGVALTGLGLAMGAAAAAGLTRFLQAMLFEISPLDPATFAGVAAILGVVGVAACWLPALRAAKVDPMVALRAE